jgi:hypothetical protein
MVLVWGGGLLASILVSIGLTVLLRSLFSR